MSTTNAVSTNTTALEMIPRTHFCKGQKICFVSVHGPNPLNEKLAVITEVNLDHANDPIWPCGVAICIEFEFVVMSNGEEWPWSRRKTWARVDELFPCL